MTASLILFVVLSSLIQYIVGALWYSGLFGKAWGKIMGFDLLPIETQQALGKSMAPFFGLQFLLTILSNVALGFLISQLRGLYPLSNLLFALFVGIVILHQVQAIIWANTQKKYWPQQIFIVLSNLATNFLIVYISALYLL